MRQMLVDHVRLEVLLPFAAVRAVQTRELRLLAALVTLVPHHRVLVLVRPAAGGASER